MKIKKGFVLREMCGENIVAGEGLENINFNKLISLNATAAFLWKKVADKEFTPEEMAEYLISRIKIAAKQLCSAAIFFIWPPVPRTKRPLVQHRLMVHSEFLSLVSHT